MSERVEDASEADGDDPALLANVRPPDWRNPEPNGPYTLLIVGGGPAGWFAAAAGSALGAKVALIERHWLGGESLNYSSVPSKTFIRTARFYAEMGGAEMFGAVPPDAPSIDIARVMARARRVRRRVSQPYSAARLQALGVDLYFGQACFTGRQTVDVDGTSLRFKKALIATGSRLKRHDIPGLDEAGYLDPSKIFMIDRLPPRVLVIGGGAEACEGAQSLARLGVATIIAMDEPLFLPGEERDAAQMISDALARDGVEIHLNTKVTRVRVEEKMRIADLDNDGDVRSVKVDAIFLGIGRDPSVEGLGLERAGVAYDSERGVHVDDFLRTSNRRIFAAGDVCLRPRFTSIAYASARIAGFNALVWKGRRFSKLTIPWCTYTDPEIAHVGLYVRQARERGIPVRTMTVAMHDVDRAVADGEETGFVKIHVREGSGEILGATIVARHAGEMINEISLAIAARVKLPVLAEVLRAYPTQAEAIRMAADMFRVSRLSGWKRWLIRLWLNR